MSVPIIRELEAERFKSNVPAFRAGDTVRVSVRIREGEKERLQDYEGLCIRRRGGGLSETFTLRRSAFGVSMERIFPLHSPRIDSIEVTRYGRVRRARLYYLRDLKGKAARIPDLRDKPGRGTKAHSALLGKQQGEEGAEAKRRKRGAKAKVARKEAAVIAAANPVPKKKKKPVVAAKPGAGGAKSAPKKK